MLLLLLANPCNRVEELLLLLLLMVMWVWLLLLLSMLLQRFV